MSFVTTRPLGVSILTFSLLLAVFLFLGTTPVQLGAHALSSEPFTQDAPSSYLASSYGSGRQHTVPITEPTSIVGTIDSTRLMADGEMMATLTVTVTNSVSEPIAEIPVVFTTTDTLPERPCIENQHASRHPRKRLSPSTDTALVQIHNTEVSTDDQGVAQTNIQAGLTPGKAYVSAKAGEVECGVEILLLGEPMYLEVDPSAITVSVDQNITPTVTVTVTVFDQESSPLPERVVNFTTNITTSQGVHLETQHKSTDDNGVVSMTIPLTTTVGSGYIIVETGHITEHIPISLLAGSPATLTLMASPMSIIANNEEISTITATVQDEFQNPVAEQTVVFSTTVSGITISPVSSPTNSMGQVSVTLRGETEGSAGVRAVVENTMLSSTITVTLETTPSQQNFLELVANPTQLYPDETLTSTITATLTDAEGSAISGQSIIFAASGGTVTPTTQITDGEGKASTLFTAEPISQVAMITATTGDIRGTASITISERMLPHTITMEATPTDILQSTSSLITMTVKDNAGRGIPRERVFVSASPGNVRGITQTTDATGVLTVTYTAPQTVTEVVIATIRAEIIQGENRLANEVKITVRPFSGAIYFPTIVKGFQRPSVTTRTPLNVEGWTDTTNTPPTSRRVSSSIIFGDDNINNCQNRLPTPGDWGIKRSVSVPSHARRATIHIDYKLFSYDRNRSLTQEFDYFQIFINKTALTPLIANTTEDPACDTSPALVEGSKGHQIDVSSLSNVEIELLVTNRGDRFFNTWVEITNAYIEWEIQSPILLQR